MKKLNLLLGLATLASVTFPSLMPFNISVQAATFEEQTIQQNNVVAVARPYGQGKYDLLIIEQIPDKQACWTENSSNPILVEPLLLKFDFTGICRRATDSNGYSIRVDGNDLGLDYLLRLVPRDGELVLVGTPRSSNYQEIVVGSTKGLASGFMKVILNPGWQFSKRAYQGKVLGHFYLSGSQAAITGEIEATETAINPKSRTTSVANTNLESVFTDINNNVYKSEVEQAADMKIMTGFEDNTFRPREAITREQLIVMAVDALGKVANVDLETQPQQDIVTFKDVSGDRWSAKKIKWAQWNFLNVGNPNNALRPTESITRAELIDTMRRVTIYLKKQLNLPKEIQQNQKPVQFSDISGNWAESVVSQMSGYCGVASPLNEEGIEFAPDRKATRDYTAAVLVRVLECIQSESKQANNITEKSKFLF
ncbi:MAG: DUF3747 domain-containing protein [cyanobacterium endosymbiont of Rhopalodia musculus]|uniref:DUF3747 domain-containing protein n=1 Tax=cyanobacterium endosymbiont of Epithemia clementina EcSB TaxID=3034674 RepID=UPI002480B913|nr:DUF3747 domain-containing protein [cyanobacterium endosymbiont of Epithemia clementina EcSB]WGT67661.1 DUF3747 domain-containing protein [cyanobacterium endosymbiont of Epithemia clementina EcSB]